MADTTGTVMSFQTRMTAATVEQILSKACMRRYDVAYKPIAVAEDGARKLVTVTFSDPKDRDRFKAAIQSGR